MTDESLSRRRLLAAASAVGVGGVAGCLGIGGPSGPPDYVCTALDDEPTERVPSDGSPIPFAFERPSVMEQSGVQTVDGGGRVVYSRTWTQTHPGRERDIDNALRLRVRYLPSGGPRGPMLGGVRRQVSVVGKRSRDGEIVGVFEREDSGRQSSLSVQFPVTESGERVFDRFDIKAEAVLGGPEEAVERAEGDDPDQTCREALQAVTTATLDSVAELTPVETETELSLSPASTSVRRGEEVELAVEAGGVDWVDLFIESETGEYSFLGGLAVGADPVPIRVAPPTGRDNVDVVTTPADTTFTVVNSVGEFTPATYDVSVAAPGLDELVTETTTLTVEPAN